MTQEDKELLLKDLSARLPYGVKCAVHDEANIHRLSGVVYEKPYGELYFNELDWKECDGFEGIQYCKPYLSPLSSMTEEQRKEYNLWKHEVPVCHYEYGDVVEEVELFDSPESFEYLIENHFDYRGLIEKGLAIDATGKNIY